MIRHMTYYLIAIDINTLYRTSRTHGTGRYSLYLPSHRPVKILQIQGGIPFTVLIQGSGGQYAAERALRV